jgi:hypothetical protein
MRSRALLAGCCLLVVTGAVVAEPARRDGWIMNDLEAARTEARKTGKPIFVVFRCER